MEPECTPGICPAGSIHDSVTKFFKSEWNGAPPPLQSEFLIVPGFQGSCLEIAERNGQPGGVESGSSACHDLSNSRGSCHKLGTRWICLFRKYRRIQGRVIFIVITVKVIIDLGKIIYTDDQMINIYIQHQSFLFDNVLKWPLYGWRWWLLFLT